MRFSENTGETFPFFHPEAKTTELVIQDVGDELLVYDLQTKHVSCLNQTAALVWQFCDGKSDLKSLTERLEEKLQKPIEVDLVLLALKELNSAGLIKNGKSIPNNLSRLSRREVVKKIGLGSLVALPIVSMIVAPPAAFAASACGPVAPGSPYGTPPTICFGTVAQCTNFCATDPAAATFCQSCSGRIVTPTPSDCSIGTTPGCQCVCV